MKIVEVHNLNVHPYKETFKGREVLIPAKGFVKMDYEQAIQFKGTMNAVERDGDGNVLPISYKMLRIVQDGASKKEIDELNKKATASKCQACGFVGADKQELHIHIKEEHAHMIHDAKVAKQLLKT